MTFEEKLREFFKTHDPSRLRFAAKIAKRFQGKSTDVMAGLATIYNSGGPGSQIAKLENKPKNAFGDFPASFDANEEKPQNDNTDDAPITENTDFSDSGIDDLDD
ncbi:MAG: hypothetical protein HOH13_01305 [Crocinitomicaceae bacterium]|jgi:hypothetical protein|nr:hypothetical protein [Crocinitomicaceae bacterium]MBT6028915.1 hypothetical protein [Crocinitomicaceae bacterium]MBT6515416.1 hypothetical protein [Crocinitomicaceae bacterium]